MEKEGFKPVNFKDYIKSKWYSVMSSKDVENGEEAAFWALIGRIAESEEALDKLKNDPKSRISWPNVPDIGDEPPTDVDNSTVEGTGSYQSCLQKNKYQRLEKKENKRLAKAEKFQSFMTNSALNYADGTCEDDRVTQPIQKDREGSESSESEESVVALKEKIGTLEQQKTTNCLSFCSNSFEENVMRGLLDIQKQQKVQAQELLNIKSSIATLEQEVESIKQACGSHDTDLSSIRKDLTDIGNSLRTASNLPASSSTSGISTISSDHKVRWAHDVNFEIREVSLTRMKVVTEITDWVICFLYGVFDEEEIPHLITRKRSNSGASVKEIDKDLLLFARGEFRKWLASTSRFSQLEIEYHMNHFGSYVGDVCVSRRGPRGAFKKVKEAKDAGKDVTGIIAEIKAAAAASAQQRAVRGDAPRNRERLGRIKINKSKTSTTEDRATNMEVTPVAVTPVAVTPIAVTPMSVTPDVPTTSTAGSAFGSFYGVSPLINDEQPSSCRVLNFTDL